MLNLDKKDDLDHHLAELPRELQTCGIKTNNSRYWSKARIINSTKGLQKEFHLSTKEKLVKLQNYLTNDFTENFCVDDDQEGVAAMGCR